MDPVTLAIINGIMCGAAGGLVTVAVPAVIKATSEFKALLLRKFGKDSALLKSVQELEQNPDSKVRKLVVAEEVEKSKAHQDEELLAAAGKLLELLEESAVGRQTIAKYQVDAQGAQVGVIGDNANVKDGIHFGMP
jgi:Tfp pilus assembly protein PilN